ncbi:serine protease inhibitor ecotin [Flavobacterium sp.]|uniref:serine protease inhibitor ecotin n=1 Tax=Flavobacterium sp. TaxID=239 RepID=UPI0026237460|nr:serine protease inhibitor ecotin [Flavobacterium sp.]
MNKLAIIITVFTTVLFATNASAQKKQQKFEKLDISMYPKAKESFKQVIIQLPIEKNEDDLKIELIIGTEKMVDCNYHNLMGKTTEEIVDGWGYNYYMVESSGVSASTRMACPNPPTKKFVSMTPIMTRYNSKLPIVLYVPQNIEVKYRIWRADTIMQKAKSK